MSLIFPRMSPLAAAHVGPGRHHLGPLYNLFNDTFNEMQRTIEKSEQSLQSFTPRFNVKEENDIYSLEGEMPGIEQKDISIEFTDDRTLTVTGRSEKHEESSNAVTEATDATAEHANGEGKGTSSEVSAPTTKSVTKAQEHGPTYWVSERSIGEFKRSFSFPTRVDQDAVKASLKNGILNITVPKKAKQTTARRINID